MGNWKMCGKQHFELKSDSFEGFIYCALTFSLMFLMFIDPSIRNSLRRRRMTRWTLNCKLISGYILYVGFGKLD